MDGTDKPQGGSGLERLNNCKADFTTAPYLPNRWACFKSITAEKGFEEGFRVG